MENVVMLRSSWAIASNRCSRRAVMSTAVSSCVCSAARAWPGRSCETRRFFALSVTRRISRTMIHQTTNETTIVATMMIAFVLIQSRTVSQKVWAEVVDVAATRRLLIMGRA